jgi:hypothetical protein
MPTGHGGSGWLYCLLHHCNRPEGQTVALLQ